MKSHLVGAMGLFLFAFVSTLHAQVPQLLNYQGRVAVGGVNFTGTGQFKFALVNAGGNSSYWTNDGTHLDGTEPTAAVSLPVNSGLYSLKLGDTALTNMTAVPATVFANADVRLRVWFNDGTRGFQQMTPDQRIAAVGYAMIAATVPDGSITQAKLAAGVGGGAIADGSITAAKLAAGAAAANLGAGNMSAVASGGVIGSTDANNAALLAQGFVRDPAAAELGEKWTQMPSGDAVAGHTAVWTGTELLIWGGVLPPTTVNAIVTNTATNRGIRYNSSTGVWTPISTVGAPQARFAHSAVWTGTEMIVWGGQTSGAQGGIDTVLATGGRYNPSTDTWSSMAANFNLNVAPPIGGLDARRGHMAFWNNAGNEMLIFNGFSVAQTFGAAAGGNAPVALAGRRYNLTTNAWSDMSVSGFFFSANAVGVWSGTEMLIYDTSAVIGWRYNPGTNAWAIMPIIPNLPAPPAIPFNFSGLSAVWSGTEMIIWGGANGGVYSNAGYRFNPAGAAGAGTWTNMSVNGAPTARANHSAVFIGGKMVIWGGDTNTGPPALVTVSLNDGGRYDPATDTWQGISAASVPPSRASATVTAAGSKMIVWAGMQTAAGFPGGAMKFLKQGGSYLPGTDVWSVFSNGSPAPRFGHSALWTGTELIVWGGTVSSNALPYDVTFNDGARFNPVTGVWTPLPTLNAPSGRYNHTAVWTGTEMIVWGGQNFAALGAPPPNNVPLNDGARYNPSTNTWTPVASAVINGPPAARSGHTAVWAGAPVNQMIVWGGDANAGGGNLLNSGGRYNPSADTWTATTATNAPAAATGHFAQWTGSEMIMFGGGLAPGSRYNPQSNSWQTMAAAPAAFGGGGGAVAYAHAWTGGESLVFLPGNPVPSFASYSPIADYWQTLTVSGAPLGTAPASTSVWTGSELIAWGLASNFGVNVILSGGRYAPATGVWTSLPTSGAPTKSYGSAVWANGEMLLWGGTPGVALGAGTASDQGHRYRLPQSFYLYRRP